MYDDATCCTHSRYVSVGCQGNYETYIVILPHAVTLLQFLRLDWASAYAIALLFPLVFCSWVTPPGVFQAYVTYATNGYLAHVSWASAWMCKYDSSYCTKAGKVQLHGIGKPACQIFKIAELVVTSTAVSSGKPTKVQLYYSCFKYIDTSNSGSAPPGHQHGAASLKPVYLCSLNLHHKDLLKRKHGVF
jgi:hypothetical protein